MTAALVLCAGMGTRLGPLGQAQAKPLVDVSGRPLLGRLLDNLARAGVHRVVINTHHRSEQFLPFVSGRSDLAPAITLHPEAELRGSAGTLHDVRHHFEGEAVFIVHYGDTLTDMDLGPLVDAARRPDTVGAIVVHRRAGARSHADIDWNQGGASAEVGIVERFEERTVMNAEATPEAWCFSGIAAFQPSIFPWLDALAARDLPKGVFPTLAAQGVLSAVALQGRRVAVDGLDRLAQARQLWSEEGKIESAT